MPGQTGMERVEAARAREEPKRSRGGPLWSELRERRGGETIVGCRWMSEWEEEEEEEGVGGGMERGRTPCTSTTTNHPQHH